MYPEYDDFYEPSEGEIFFDEIKEKFREILREDVNSEISRLQKLLHCIQYCYIHGVLTDSQMESAHKKFIKQFQDALYEK